MIFYFSGTGNSRYAAAKLAVLTDDKAYNIADIFNGLQIRKDGRQDVTGFVFPVYFSGLPEMVERFAKLPGVKNLLGDYVYCVITCGGSPAAADVKLSEALEREIDFSAGLMMPDNYVICYNPCDKERAKEKIIEADRKLNEIGRCINKKKLYFKKNFTKSAATAIMYPFYKLFRTTFFFEADKNCTGCGQCASLCPEKAIVIKDGIPEWVKNKCQHCTACINACPQSAIQFTRFTKKRGRYYILNINK